MSLSFFFPLNIENFDPIAFETSLELKCLFISELKVALLLLQA